MVSAMIDPVYEDEEESTASNAFSEFETLSGVEEIVLGNEFDETASVIIPRKTNHQYIQVSKFRGIKRFFKIFNDVYLHQSIESFRNKNKSDTRLNLTFIDPEPIRKIHFAWNWVYSAYVTIFLGALLIYIGEFSGLVLAHPYMLPISVVLITAGMIFSMIFFYRTQDKIIYKSLVGQVPLIEMFNRPNQADFKRFTESLVVYILQSQRRLGLTMKQRLIGELSDLRRLSEEGIITVEAYEQARAIIFKHKEYQ